MKLYNFRHIYSTVSGSGCDRDYSLDSVREDLQAETGTVEKRGVCLPVYRRRPERRFFRNGEGFARSVMEKKTRNLHIFDP